jgi:hypothetical protein
VRVIRSVRLPNLAALYMAHAHLDSAGLALLACAVSDSSASLLDLVLMQAHLAEPSLTFTATALRALNLSGPH